MSISGTILVVDHDDEARKTAVSVAVRLGFPVRSAENAELAWELLDGERPALAIVEVELSGHTSGLELMRELHRVHGRELPVILVSATRTAPLDHVAGLLLGAEDYLSKPFDPGELLARARRSLTRSTAPSSNGTANGEPGLSPRELEILGLLARGVGQTEIAQRLVVSPKTVATHIQHVLSKLGVHSRAQAVAEAFRLGLVNAEFEGHAFDVGETDGEERQAPPLTVVS